MKIIRLQEIEKTLVKMDDVKDVFKQVAVSKNDGSPTFSLRVFTVGPNGHTPYHRHEFEHLNYVIEGNGALVNEAGEEQEITKGDFALVLPGEKHQYRNKSDKEDFVMICGVPNEYE